jgi:tRNA modification GTPase
MDTIFSLATTRGKAGVAVFRISGRDAHAAVLALCGDLPANRRASVRTLTHGGDVLDEALVIVFAEGASFTGEQMAELQVHGSVAVIQDVARALSSIAGLRQAGPGEFTRRALENGRLDLAQVEGLADLIDAETEAQKKQAIRILSGAVGRRAEMWRASLIRSAALIEATIDFSEEDVPVDVVPEVQTLLAAVLKDLREETVGSIAAERVRDGFEVAIVGPPNAGKSTLLNALAGRDAAITSERAGTTRDVIEVRMNLSGIPVVLLDTAGLRESDDEIEQLGIDRGMRRAEAADLRVFLLDRVGSVPFLSPRPQDIVIHGKADLRPGVDNAVSGTTGAGLDLLIDRIVEVLQLRVGSAGIMTRERHRAAMARAIMAIESAQEHLIGAGSGPEFVAAELWVGVRSLDQLVGRVDVEDLLGEIFASFCIGK